MTSTTGPVPLPVLDHSTTSPEVPTRPGRGRRTAIAAAAFAACALPTVFTINISRMLLVGELADHRFHQATGQGLVLFVLWLVPLAGMLRAGWQGRRPSSALGLWHLSFVATGVVCAAIAPGGGAPFLVGVVVVTGALVWAVLPRRPRLRRPVRLHPLLAPVALLGAALLLPYVVDQLAAQNAATGGHHAQNPHLFDMAWMSLCLVVLAALAALLPSTRRLASWFAVLVGVTGAAGLAFGEDATRSWLTLGVGALAGLAGVLARRDRGETSS